MAGPARAGFELKAVSVAYNSRRGRLEHVDRSIGAGEHVAVIGESGAGKTTLGDLLVGFVQPTEGAVNLERG